MNCWHCNYKLRWDNDFDYFDYGVEGDGIVSELSCDNNNCGVVTIRVYCDCNTQKNPKIAKLLIEKNEAMKRYTEKLMRENYDRKKRTNI